MRTVHKHYTSFDLLCVGHWYLKEYKYIKLKNLHFQVALKNPKSKQLQYGDKPFVWQRHILASGVWHTKEVAKDSIRNRSFEKFEAELSQGTIMLQAGSHAQNWTLFSSNEKSTGDFK